ncbi:MAG: terminase [Acidobacteria bacterium SCN 69-37]|nr:MAG: terminase [Acidobacteria bacterium SCN 69-37]
MGLRGPRARVKALRYQLIPKSKTRGPRARVKAAPKRTRRPAWQKPGLSRAERVIAFIESLPVTKGIRAGKTMTLLPYQRAFIEAVYGEQSSVRLAIQSIPRGNGKTGLQAGICLAHLLGPEAEPRGEVYAAAIDRQQAGLLFNEIVAIIEAVPEFDAACNIQRFKKLVEVLDGPSKGSVFETLSADVRRGHGLSPTLFVYDEFAQARTGDLLDTLITAQGKRTRSLGMVISTQAADDLHPLSVLIDDAQRGLDPSLYCQLIAAPVDADPFDEATWRACNPALDSFLDANELRTQAERAQRVPTFAAKFKNLRLNLRIATEERWLPIDAWQACAGTVDLDALAGARCFGGLDLGSTRDLTSFALFWPEAGSLAVWSWCPAETLTEREQSDRAPFRVWAQQGHIEATPGRATDKRRVALRLGELCARFQPTAIAFDRWGIAELARVLGDEGITLPLREFGQGFKDMAPATAAFETRVLNGAITHDSNPLVTWSLGNVALERDAAGNAKPHKRKSTERIDPIVAAIMAVGLAAQEPPPPRSVYADRGLVFV